MALARSSARSVPVADAALAGPVTGSAGPPGPRRTPQGVPLLLSREPSLVEEVARLAAAAGVRVHVTADLSEAVRLWGRAALVLVGSDLAGELVPLGLRRRSGVQVLAWEQVPEHLFRSAVALGAEAVSDLPRSGGWLAELLADLDERAAPPGRVVGVVAGCGGAGATTLAAALAQRAATLGPALAVDADPLGPGLDRVLGLESRQGVRWADLCRTTGRISARSLRDAVPRRGELGVLTWAAGVAEPLPAFAAREVLSAAQRGHRHVVLDLPRAGGAVGEELLARCDVVLVVTTPGISAVAATARWCRTAPDSERLRLVVRGPSDAAEACAQALRVPLAAAMAPQRGLDEALDLGLGPVRSPRGPLGRTARDLLERVSLLGEAA